MRVLWLLVPALCLLAGCNSGAIGSGCSGGPTEEGVCVEGAVCAPDIDPSVTPPEPPNAVPSYCRATCDVISDCEPGFQCRVVAGSMVRACQPPLEPASADAGT